MAIQDYPSYAQCEGSTREEITQVLSSVSTNGTLRGRVMHSAGVYRLTLVHLTLSAAEAAAWDAFWENFHVGGSYQGDSIRVTWAVDGDSYVGILETPPSLSYDNANRRYRAEASLLVQKE